MSGSNSDPYGLSEVDEFAAKREQVLLNNSSLNERRNHVDDILNDEEEEEVLSMSDESDDDEEVEEEEGAEEELDGEKAYRHVFGRKLDISQAGDEDDDAMLNNENAWGATKNEYYGADEMEDGEDAKEIEQEALRQQKKHLQELNMEDYLDDELDEEWSKDAKQFDVSEFQNLTKQTDISASIKDILNMDNDAKNEYLKTMLPEYMPLCKELAQLSDVLNEIKCGEKSESTKLKELALSSYLATISSYFGILLHELHTNEDFVSMKEHPVMEAILTSKEVWRQASELPETEEMIQTEQIESDQDDIVDGEIEELDQDMLNKIPTDMLSEESSEEEQNGEEDDDAANLDDFEEYIVQSRISKNKDKSKKTREEAADDFLESEMNDVDAQEKKARRRTLRFYTSKIDQQANKKLDKLGGDDDIPYKERFFERQQRLLEEARKRGLNDSNGADLDGKDYVSEDESAANAINNASTIDYYNQIQKEREQRKTNRRASHKTAVIAAREGKLAEAIEAVGNDGKRAINYQILKNKGLTPKRKKDNRNARVKKRKKYEQAKKKLRSVRAVYSGGQSGTYEGEKTGIKKNLIRSVKFKN